jgi:hypothetical protein
LRGDSSCLHILLCGPSVNFEKEEEEEGNKED